MKRILVVLTAVRTFDLEKAKADEETASDDDIVQIYKETAVDDPFAFIDSEDVEVSAHVELVEVK